MTVAAMAKLGAERARIAAAIGPCISQASYEVDGEFRAFVQADSANARFFAPSGREDYFQFDLKLMSPCGSTTPELRISKSSRPAPLRAPSDFYSFRRATYAGEKATGAKFRRSC